MPGLILKERAFRDISNYDPVWGCGFCIVLRVGHVPMSCGCMETGAGNQLSDSVQLYKKD